MLEKVEPDLMAKIHLTKKNSFFCLDVISSFLFQQ